MHNLNNKFVLVIFALILISTNLYSQQPSIVWSARYNSSTNGDDRAFDMDMDNVGNVFVTGRDGNPQGVITIKYNSSGQQQWINRFSNHLSIVSQPDKIKTDRFGNVFVVGHDSHGFIIKYDSIGIEKWVTQFAQFNAWYSDIAVSKSGFIYAAGGTPRSNPYGDILLVKYNPQGDTVWMRTFNIPSNRGAGATSIYLDDSNYVYITGAITIPTSIDTVQSFCTMKYDSLGVMKWMRSYRSSVPNRDGQAMVIKGDKRGNVYVTGYMKNIAQYGDFCTIKYSNDGTQKWINFYTGVAYGGGLPKDMAVDSTGNVFVTGYSSDSLGIYNYATIKYDTTGVQKWVRRFASIGMSDNIPTSICIDKSQNCYITGSFSTMKYDSSGALKWTIENVDPQSPFRYRGVKIIVDKDNNIFVNSGGAGSVGSTLDILTIKYSQTTNVVNPGITNIDTYKLNQNYPNPFNSSTIISYSLNKYSNTKITVFDLLGKEIATLVNEKQNAGKYEVIFDGSKLSTGVYYYTLFIDGNKIDTKRLVLIK